jgi:hypothetical protein
MESMYKYIGSGMFSIVYENFDNISVIKVTDDRAWLNFIEKVVLKNKNVHFPKIYQVIALRHNKKTFAHAVIMEKLRGSMPRLVKNKTTEQIFSAIKSHRYLEYEPLRDHRSYPISYRKSIALLRLLNEDNEYGIDFQSSRRNLGNVMFRDNGELVITDPFYVN